MSVAVITVFLYIFVFLFGIVIGSFLNVCIYRIPLKESIVFPHSHCMTCGYQLRWYDLVPLFSFLFLRGRCRKCHTKLSLQYPLVEGMNGALYVIVFLANGWNYMSVVYCLLTSALIVLSVLDFRTMEIADGINLFILLLGIAATLLDLHAWKVTYRMFSVSVFLLVIYLVTTRKGNRRRRYQADVWSRTFARMERCGFGVFLGVHYRFGSSSDPYGGKSCRASSGNGSLFVCGNLAHGFVGDAGN